MVMPNHHWTTRISVLLALTTPLAACSPTNPRDTGAGAPSGGSGFAPVEALIEPGPAIDPINRAALLPSIGAKIQFDGEVVELRDPRRPHSPGLGLQLIGATQGNHDLDLTPRRTGLGDCPLKGVAASSADFEVREGRIVVKSESLFKQNSYEIDQNDADRRFGAARTALVDVLETVARDLADSAGNVDAAVYVEVRVVGHSDCQPFPPNSDFDNMDLSALRGVALVKYLTQPCRGTTDQFVCCPDGTATCEGDRNSKRIDPHRWTILPSGRGSYEPRDLSEQEAQLYRTACQELDPDLLQRQRRVVIELVPRIDKLLIK
jgi:hypothetical protein